MLSTIFSLSSTFLLVPLFQEKWNKNGETTFVSVSKQKRNSNIEKAQKHPNPPLCPPSSASVIFSIAFCIMFSPSLLDFLGTSTGDLGIFLSPFGNLVSLLKNDEAKGTVAPTPKVEKIEKALTIADN